MKILQVAQFVVLYIGAPLIPIQYGYAFSTKISFIHFFIILSQNVFSFCTGKADGTWENRILSFLLDHWIVKYFLSFSSCLLSMCDSKVKTECLTWKKDNWGFDFFETFLQPGMVWLGSIELFEAAAWSPGCFIGGSCLTPYNVLLEVAYSPGVFCLR